MKILRERFNKAGRLIVTVELDVDEMLTAITDGSHYQLADPVSDVVGSHILIDARQVQWCSASQKWVDA